MCLNADYSMGTTLQTEICIFVIKFFLIKTVRFLLPPSPHRIHFPGERILMFEGMEDNNRKMDDGDKIFDQQYTTMPFPLTSAVYNIRHFFVEAFTASVGRMNHTMADCYTSCQPNGKI